MYTKTINNYKIVTSFDPSDVKDGVIVIPEGIKGIGINASQNLFERMALTTEDIEYIFDESLGKKYPISFMDRKTIVSERKVRDSLIAKYGIEKMDVMSFENVRTISTKRCFTVKDLVLPESLEFIGDYAFRGLSMVKKAELPKSVKKLGSGVFYECERLSSCILPEGLKEVPAETFTRCYSLRGVKLPSTVTKIGNGAFESSGVVDCCLNENITDIGDFAYCDCTELKTANIPSSVRKVGARCFTMCKNLENVNFQTSESEVTIGDCVFSSCINLQNVNLGNRKIKSGQNVMFMASENVQGIPAEWYDE